MRKVAGGIYENTCRRRPTKAGSQALPIEVDVSPMYARKDLFAKVGMGMPQTWEELRAASRRSEGRTR